MRLIPSQMRKEWRKIKEGSAPRNFKDGLGPALDKIASWSSPDGSLKTARKELQTYGKLWTKVERIAQKYRSQSDSPDNKAKEFLKKLRNHAHEQAANYNGTARLVQKINDGN